MILNRYSDKQIKVLKALAHYKFLTYKQMSRLDIDKHTSNLSALVKGLREGRYPLVRKIPHRRGTPVKHYLTAKGKEILLSIHGLEVEHIKFPKGIIHTDTQDQKHRTTTIDIQIELEIACNREEIDILISDRYFDTTGNNRTDANLKSKTAVIYEGQKTLKADYTFMLRVEGIKELYLMELENGKDSKKATQKILNYSKAIFLGSVNEKYDYKKAFRSLWIFEHESTMKSVIKRMKSNEYLKNIKEWFLFKTVEEIKAKTFFTDWKNLQGDLRQMYYRE